MRARRPRTVAIIQARTGSTRLPDKVLLSLCGRPMLEHIVNRVRSAQTLDHVVVATSEAENDRRIAQLCEALQVPCFRGSESDVLDRYYQAAMGADAEVVVRLTADNPLVEPAFIDWCVARFHDAGGRLDYCDTTTSMTFPYGLSVEIFTIQALASAWREAESPEHREHVTGFIRQHPARFNLLHLAAEPPVPDLRWTVDTPDDFERVRLLYEALNLGSDIVPYRDVVAFQLKQA